MIKKIFSLILLLSVLAGMFLTSCSKYDENGILKKRPDIGELDSETEEQIKQAYLKYILIDNTDLHDLTTDDVWIEKYYGNYDDCKFIILYCKSLGAVAIEVREYINDEIVFSYASPWSVIYVYNNRKFYRIKEAYEEGIITLKSIKEVYDIRNYDNHIK